MSNMNDEFLEAYDEAIDDALISATPQQQQILHAESALCKVLKRFADELPAISDERFHKNFRQFDVIDHAAPEDKGGLMDMVVWNLLYPCNLFWKTRTKFFAKEESESNGSD